MSVKRRFFGDTLTPKRLMLLIVVVAAVSACGVERFKVWSQYNQLCEYSTKSPNPFYDEDPFGTRSPIYNYDAEGNVHRWTYVPYSRKAVGLNHDTYLIMAQGGLPPTAAREAFWGLTGCKSPNGKRWLVMADMAPSPSYPCGYAVFITLTAYAEPSLLPFTRCSRMQTPHAQGYQLVLDQGDGLKLFHAETHRTDRSRFTLPYELRGIRGDFEVWIDGNESLNMRILSGPLDPTQLTGGWPVVEEWVPASIPNWVPTGFRGVAK